MYRLVARSLGGIPIYGVYLFLNVSEQNEGHAICIVYFWVSLDCIFLGISDKEKHVTMIVAGIPGIFLGFSEKRKERYEIIPSICLGFLKKKQQNKDM